MKGVSPLINLVFFSMVLLPIGSDADTPGKDFTEQWQPSKRSKLGVFCILSAMWTMAWRGVVKSRVDVKRIRELLADDADAKQYPCFFFSSWP